MLFVLFSSVFCMTMAEREAYTSIKYYGVQLPAPVMSQSRVLTESHPDWMSKVKDDVKIHAISIPGTHETCSMYGGPLVACQDLSIMDQLLSGVRFLDIRCRHINDCFMIHHDSVYQQLSFGTGVRDVCIQFLKQHPKEFIFMMVKEEYTPAENTRTFAETMKSYLTNDFYLQEGSHTLKEVRGKIVLIRRFDSSISPMGNKINFKNDQIFTSVTTITARVQDCYYVGTLFDRGRKWNNFNTLLTEARANTNKDELFINYASGSSAFCYPYSTCEYMNPLVGNYLTQSQPKAYTGTLMLDYINHHFTNLINAIIQRNFDS